ncbi:MAG: hypothetical protein Q4F17_05195 [Eubacteriales bacterium]|nr:hypothetical protein [Eubacteriales bacterium]
MYNRYIPQSDGSYQKNRVPDKARSPDSRPDQRRPQQPSPVCPPPPRPCRERPEPPAASGIGSFLKNLLPKDFDTEDLLIILLFLLMSRDCEDQNSALLTLALYLFL